MTVARITANPSILGGKPIQVLLVACYSLPVEKRTKEWLRREAFASRKANLEKTKAGER